MSDKIKFEMEFPLHASPKMLYQHFSTASGLSEWFADNVNSRGEIFTFIWDGAEEKATLLTKKTDEKVKFRWEEDEDDNVYFEFRIQVDELTKDVSVIVTDFADDDDEVEEQKMFWEKQIGFLKKNIGA